jgi:acyl carrier protein
MTPERVNRVFAPKVRGAWVLHTLTRSIPLDFFVLCSSVSAVFGSPGQSNYAAANAWMDALARMRVAQGLPALSVNWGAWREVGMAARLSDGQRDRWAAQGFALIPPAMAGNALWRALRARSAQAIVQPVDWAMFGRALGHRPIPPLLSELVHETVDRARSDKASPDEARLRLADTPAGERADRLRAHIRTQVAQVLGLDSDAAVGDDQPLTELGIDSLMAVELSNRLNASLGTALAPTFAFEFPTVSGITTHLLDAMADSDAESHSSSSVDAIVDEVSSLDAEAVDDLLGRLEDSGTASTR